MDSKVDHLENQQHRPYKLVHTWEGNVCTSSSRYGWRVQILDSTSRTPKACQLNTLDTRIRGLLSYLMHTGSYLQTTKQAGQNRNGKIKQYTHRVRAASRFSRNTHPELELWADFPRNHDNQKKTSGALNPLVIFEDSVVAELKSADNRRWSTICKFIQGRQW